MSEPRISLPIVEGTLRHLLDRPDRRLAMVDRATGEEVTISPDLAASPTGFLPVFLVAADAVWRDATGKSFGIELARDPATMLGFRSAAVNKGPFSAVMLSMMEAVEQTARPGLLLMNDFDGFWRGIEAGLASSPRQEARRSPAPGVGR